MIGILSSPLLTATSGAQQMRQKNHRFIECQKITYINNHKCQIYTYWNKIY